MADWTIGQMRDAVERHSAFVVGGTWAEVCNYLEEAQYAHPEDEPEGVVVDVQTANAIVLVYDALSPAQRERFVSLPVEQAAAIAWRSVRAA